MVKADLAGEAADPDPSGLPSLRSVQAGFQLARALSPRSSPSFQVA